MTETGAVQVDHHQFLLAAPTVDTTDIAAEGNLIWTGPGFVTVLTGIAYGPVTLTVEITTTPSPLDGWEQVEETVIDSRHDLRVITLDGEAPADFSPIPSGHYRVRVHARGRDSAEAGMEATEPTETYLVTLTPTVDPVGTITDPTESSRPDRSARSD
ncbi:hypothetical protein ACWEKT_25170 [Nocardia takedensis]